MITGLVLTELQKDRLNQWVANLHERNGDPPYWLPGGQLIYSGPHAGKYFVSWDDGTKAMPLKRLTPRVRLRMAKLLYEADGVERELDLSTRNHFRVREIHDVLEIKFPAILNAIKTINEAVLIDPNADPV